MFTGIVEEIGEVVSLKKTGSNLSLEVRCSFSGDLAPDQSISHDGVCLTVVKCSENSYFADVVAETLARSSLQNLSVGSKINLERSLHLNSRLDGHFVQGHIDQTAVLLHAVDNKGSWIFTFQFTENPRHLLIDKGSIAVNGISLTVFGIKRNDFSVSVIPHTYDRTNLQYLKAGDPVNIEFDLIGKYVEGLNES